MNNKAADPGTPVESGLQHSNKSATQGTPGSNADTIRQCPECRIGQLVLDGCLNLTCSVCGHTDTGGGFT